MEANKELDDIMLLLDKGQLSVALEQLAAFVCKYPELNMDERLDGLRSDYERMVEYWATGYRDPQLESIHNVLRRRAYRLAADAYVRYDMAHSPYTSAVRRRIDGAGRDWSMPVLRAALEGFVTDAAMLELEPEHVRKQKKNDFYSARQRLMNDLFDHIWTSQQWNEGMAEAYEDILLSPTVDTNDQQVIVSALMLSTMNMFDINKFRLLVTVYRRSTDENVRQRALVGWVLSVKEEFEGLFPEQRQMVEEMLQDEAVRDELTELQIQLFYCVMAESDTKKIQKEIMPDLLKHNNLHITPTGIEEKAEDPMQDILDPEASERNMEKVEEGFRKMVDMQKAGSDIYFGGFSQMKRFPFFSSVSNWFVPFYPEHPAVSAIYERMGHGRLLGMMMNRGSFCNSDKYSFVLAFSQVIDRIPQSMRSIIDNGDIAGLGRMSETDTKTPAYIRRTYLQDLYRFFRLFPSRSQFRNPFDIQSVGKSSPEYVFFSKRIFRGTELESRFGEIGSFMVKHKMYDEVAGVICNYSDKGKDYQYYMLFGHVLLRGGGVILDSRMNEMKATDCFEHALRLQKDELRALKGYARALFYEERYAEARDAYARLMAASPETMTYALSYSVCLTNLWEYDEALKVLYRLDYENPDNVGVSRVMARALVGAGKYEQARRVYEKLRSRGVMDSNDRMNNGYCEWFAGNHRAAAESFAAYLKMRYPNESNFGMRKKAKEDIVGTELKFILEHGVTQVELEMMLDVVCAEMMR
ncbi:MAG: hypothetical protein K2G86_03650 [Prevotella sp.]|nr:hypothetical protein [Prevotella sp.]